MDKKFLHTIFLIFLLIISGCSVEKNTRMTRFYHNMTAHYNVYFNGKESLKEGVEQINSSVEDDYTKLLPVFKSNNESTATIASSQMDYAIQKASKLIALHSITTKPKRRKNRTEAYQKLKSIEEYNNWVDDAYLLMGQAYFYMHQFNPAVDNFSYITRKFREEEIKYDAYIWLIRSYTLLERYVEAAEVIQTLNGDENFPKRLEGELAIVTADYHIHQLEYEEAIPFLSIAIKKTLIKKNKLRYKYILAQLYEETGNSSLATQTYREVAHMNPPYKMAFNARINAAEAFSGEGDAAELKKELQRMLKDQKNVEFRDQIYFALANIAKNESNGELAKSLYIKSAASSSSNMYQRALSCLTLADIYFGEPEYLKSKAYYDSAMVVIDEKYPGYKDISERHKNLTLLVDNINTVQTEDSLQRIAQMSESERNALVDQWIRKAKEEEQKKKEQEQQQKTNRSYLQTNLGATQTSNWYFYTPTTVAYGRVEFKNTWGTRKLEDGWRRSNKLSRAEFEAEELAEEQKTDTINNVVRVIDPEERGYYLQDLPLNDSLMVLSHARIRDALYNMGRIFKTVYNNYPRAIDAYLDLNKRYPSNIYQLSSFFELWDIYTKIGDRTNADFYKNRIIQEYPKTNYAKYLQNPNYFIELEAQKDSINNIYQQAFYQYSQGNYNEAGRLSDQMLKMNPDSATIPKIEFFRTIAMGTSSDRNSFNKLLTDYIAKFPTAETTPLASKILSLIQDSTLVDYQKLVASGYLNDKIQNKELQTKNPAENDEFGGKFSYDDDLLHYFVIAYPKDAGVDINRLKFDIANYNIDHYTKLDFDIETENLGSNTELVVVRALENKETSLIYFRSIIRKREVFETLRDVKYANFVISSTNYREITADKDYNDYLKFFIKNYSRFISGDFTEEILPSPEELMAKAKAEENKLEEQGTFVMVSPGRKSRIYNVEPNAPQNFVIAVNDPSFSMRQMLSEFSDFDRKNYKEKGLKISQEQINGYRMIVIKSFPNKEEALSYFTKVVTTRDLFSSLGTMSYRNFLISDGNLKSLIETGNLENYMSFFSDVYLKGHSAEESGSETAPANTNQKTDSESVAPEIPSYSGPFNQDITGLHSFVLVIPVDGINKSETISAIEKFNTTDSADQGLKLRENSFGTEQQMIIISGFKDSYAAMEYLKTIVKDNNIYDPLQDVDYRNFVISEQNLKILLAKKDLPAYIEFYKLFYLK